MTVTLHMPELAELAPEPVGCCDWCGVLAPVSSLKVNWSVLVCGDAAACQARAELDAAVQS
ncbi:MAG: hypothetical protein ACLQDY_08325 [Streptosporangiaceae bacterium]